MKIKFLSWTQRKEIELENLRGADLCGANLCDADLYDANLRGANLYGANLCDANLRGANLCGANLCDADLYVADLHGANLCGANLYGANLRNANLCDNMKIKTLHTYSGLYKYEVWSFVDDKNEPWVRMGCLYKPISEWDKITIEKSNLSEFPDDNSDDSTERARAFYFARAQALLDAKRKT